MKKIILRFILLSLPFLVGCGKDGIDGSVYILFDDNGNCMNTFTNSDSHLPGIFYYGVNYKTDAGSYSYYAEFCDFSSWSGTYSLTKNYGTSGGFLRSGEDGADKNYSFVIHYWTAPTISRLSHGFYVPLNPISESVTSDGKIFRKYDLGKTAISITSSRTEKQNSLTK